MRKIVETITNIAIIAVCVLIGWTFFTHKSLSFGSAPEENIETSLQGHTLPALQGYRWGDHKKTLVLAIRKGCHFCEDSLPFYKQLGNLENSNSLHAHVLAVMPDDKVSATAALQAGGISVEGIFTQPLDSIKVSGTPTILLLDANGRIARAWVGQLTAQREKDVIAAAEK